MKISKPIVLLVIIGIVSLSCEKEAHLSLDVITDNIRNDESFQSLLHMVNHTQSLDETNYLVFSENIRELVQVLDERYIRSRPAEYHNAFREIFYEEVNWVDASLPVRQFSTSYDVSAPVEFVWQTLVEVESYPEWNPFTPIVETTFEVGSQIVMYVRLFPMFPDVLLRQSETVVEFHINDMMCWETILGSSFWFLSHRCYEVMEIDNGTVLSNSMVYEGLLAPLVNSLTRQLVMTGFHNVSMALKDRIE